MVGLAQHGPRDKVATRPALRRQRIVAIELGTCRSGRSGGASGSVTPEKGKFLDDMPVEIRWGKIAFFGDEEGCGRDAGLEWQGRYRAGDGWDHLVPGGGGKLAGDQRRARAVVVLDNLHQIAPLIGGEAFRAPSRIKSCARSDLLRRVTLSMHRPPPSHSKADDPEKGRDDIDRDEHAEQ